MTGQCFYRALVVDYDGTLTTTPTPSVEVREALRASRRRGLRVVLITGRILSDLRADFPDVDSEFDGIVGENGAVTWSPEWGERKLVAPVDDGLYEAIRLAGVPCVRGQVLLATYARYDRLVRRIIAERRSEYQVIYNRDALMILPASVSKGSGLFEALGDLGISHHSVIAVGDAENDHSLVEFCELGVAVSNAVPSLQAHADIVLGEPDGRGVRELLEGPLLRGEIRVRPRRWQVRIGARPAGDAVMVPGSQTNVLIVGGSGSGKSYLAGLLVEQLSVRGYSVCVLDPEGDHVTLGNLRGVLVVGGASGLPEPERVAELLTHRFGSVVIDLSRLTAAERARRAREYLGALLTLRRETGLPHWIVIDEAPDLLGTASAEDVCGPASQGFCLVTWQPERLPPGVFDQMDVVLAVPGGEESLGKMPGFPASDARARRGDPLRVGEALLLERGSVVRFRVAARRRPHVRHWHKYLSSRLPPSAQFFFRTAKGPTGAVAGNVAEFHHEIEHGPDDVLIHHLAEGDFSRWVGLALQDRPLAKAVRLVERAFQDGVTPEVAPARERLVAAVEERYGTERVFTVPAG